MNWRISKTCRSIWWLGFPHLLSRTTLTRSRCSRTWRSYHLTLSATARNGPLASNFGNALMTQQMARMADYRPAPGPSGTGDPGPQIGDSVKAEDLIVFTVQH